MKNILISLVGVVALLLSSGRLIAHDPGTSLGVINTAEDPLHIYLSLTLSDIESVTAVDSNEDSMISADELEHASNELSRLFAQGVRVHQKSELKIADTVEFSVEDDDTLLVSLNYVELDPGLFEFSMPLLAQLPRGHRQYLQVNDQHTSIQHVLSAKSNSVAVGLYNHNSPAENSTTKFKAYFIQGLDHIFFGIDHLLFLLTLLLPALLASKHLRNSDDRSLKFTVIDIIKVVTAFSIAHSITLGLALYQFVQLPDKLVEVVIAFSIVICAVHNLKSILPVSRWVLAFGFGLVHGFGFAGALTSLGFTGQETILPLLAFNLGIEAGQIAIIIVVVPVLYMIRHTSFFTLWIYRGGSVATILIASAWMIDRLN